MRWALAIVAALLLLGPLRRPFFRNWRFTVPATAAGVGAWVFACGAVRSGDPWWFRWGVAGLVALGAGAAVKEWLDGTFGKGK